METVPLTSAPLEQAFLPSSRSRVWQRSLHQQEQRCPRSRIFAQLSEVPTSLKALRYTPTQSQSIYH